VAAEEERLSAMIADALVYLALQVPALPVALEDARLKVLLEPVGVGQWQIREDLLPLHVVPGRAHVVVPRYDPLHGVADNVDVNRFWQVEPGAGKDEETVRKARRGSGNRLDRGG